MDRPCGQIGAGGEEEQQLGERVEVEIGVGEQAADTLRRLGPPRLADQQRLGAERLGQQLRLRRLARAVDALKRNEQMTAPDRRHAASSVAQIALLFGLPASLPGNAWVASFRSSLGAFPLP